MSTRRSDSTIGKPFRCMLALIVSLLVLSACTPGAIEQLAPVE
jgi:hypothetical protein